MENLLFKVIGLSSGFLTCKKAIGRETIIQEYI